MFLNSNKVLNVRATLFGKNVCRFLWAAFLLIPCIGQSQESRLPCFLELPTYDARGNKLQFNIVSAKPEEHPDINLLAMNNHERRMSVQGNVLYFSKRALGERIEIVLQGSKGENLVARVALMACEQRASQRYGERDTGADVAWSSVTGRLSGCRLVGDWWLRAMPMFGNQLAKGSFEGYIRRADGTFWLDSTITGERYIVIVGRAKEPIKVVAIDVIVGGKNDVGIIDLSGSCEAYPK
jgi:hypothetical protein